MNRFLMEEVEMPLIPVVADMEEAGYRIDRKHFDDLRARLKPEQGEVLGRIRTFAGATFNPASPPQMRDLLYDKLKVRVARRTASGERSTDKAVMKRAAAEHEVARDIVRYRKLNKILTTYTTIPEKVDEDGRLRVAFNQVAAETGRFSSASIVQTIPKDDEFQIRRGFIAEPMHLIVGADFNQQELRVLAQCSGDGAMKAAIRPGLDLHGLAAVRVFGLDCDPNQVDTKFKGERQRVKAIQFGLIYGRSAFSLAEELGIPRERPAGSRTRLHRTVRSPDRIELPRRVS